MHIHVRNPDESPSSDPELFAQVQEGVRKHCPGMIVQFSTGGRGRTRTSAARCSLRPDMASLATGSVNFRQADLREPAGARRRPRARDAGVRRQAGDRGVRSWQCFTTPRLADRGLIKRPLHVQFVIGIPNALPARRKVLEFLIAELKDIMPDATWAAAGIGRHQLEVNQWCLELGGHVRTGLEDNIKFDKDRLARSNAELVARVAELCGEYGRHAASPAEARQILELPTAEIQGKTGGVRQWQATTSGGPAFDRHGRVRKRHRNDHRVV